MPCGGSRLKSRPAVPNGHVEVGEDHVGAEQARHRPGDVVGDRGGADAALGADEGVDLAELLGAGVAVDARDRRDDRHHVDRRHQIFGDAALQELAIEPHVVGMADHHDLGAGVADLGEAVERARSARRRAAGVSTRIRFGVGAER